MRSIINRFILLVIAGQFIAGTWFYYSWKQEKQAHNAVRNDNVRLLAAYDSQQQAIKRISDGLKLQSVLLAERDARVSKYNEAACDMAIAIQGAKNDSQECDIDSVLPHALSRPLLVLYSQRAGNSGNPDRMDNSAKAALSAQTHARSASTGDFTQSGSMDSHAHALGQ